MQPDKTTPCPFCKRPIKLADQPSGKLRCRQCYNYFFYDAIRGEATPLAPDAAKKIPAPSRLLRFIRSRMALLSLAASIIILGMIFWLTIPRRSAPIILESSQPETILEEVSRQLKSLTE